MQKKGAKRKRKENLNASTEVFVGRHKELAQFKDALKDPDGQAVVVVGNRGMGKTWLINKMARIAESDGQLKCGWVRYEVTPNDMPDSTMALMMDHAFEAAQIDTGSFNGTPKRLAQWRAFLNVFNIGDLVMSLRRDQQRNTRDQFLKRLELISKHMPENGRALFVIDPEKYMRKDSDQDWAIVVKDLPEKIKLVFAQRTEDVLVKSDTFGELTNVVHIPGKWLGELDEKAVDELINLRANEVGVSEKDLREALAKYKGHPYVVQGALDLIKAGTDLDQLPQDPKGIARAQWEKLSGIDTDAIRLFKAYAILEVAVPDEVTEAVSGLDSDTLQHLSAEKYISGLLRDEADGRRIYHAILDDYILDQMSKEERDKYHRRAIEIYHKKLTDAMKGQSRRDEMAAIRLSEHVLSAEGEKAFVKVLLGVCGRYLVRIGSLDTAKDLWERSLGMVIKGSEDEGAVIGNLGDVFRIRGNLDKAEEMHKRSLEIHKGLGIQEEVAKNYGNLGGVYIQRGDLDKAKEALKKSLDIHKTLKSHIDMAINYNNLGAVYRSESELNLKKAGHMHLEALKISEMLGEPSLLVNSYFQLGVICQNRGDLNKAEELYNKSLKITEQFGFYEPMAGNYSNLGRIWLIRKNVEKAQAYWEKARDLYEQMGMPHEVKKVQGWIDELGE